MIDFSFSPPNSRRAQRICLFSVRPLASLQTLLPSPTTIDDDWSGYKGKLSDGSVLNDNRNKINKEEEAAQLIRKSDGLSKYPDYYGTNVRHVSILKLKLKRKTVTKAFSHWR